MAASVQHCNDLFNMLEHIRLNNIPGDLVECGVWKGGIVLGIMEYLYYNNMTDRRVWLYDTFNGLTEPTEDDYGIYDYKELDIKKMWLDNKVDDTTNYWCLSTLDEVKNNLSESKFPKENVRYVVGDICLTLKDPQNIPDVISLLRLDTDWYESTKMEMEVLYPRVSPNGYVIVDDYNCWNGSRKAVNEIIDSSKLNNKYESIRGPLSFIKQ